MSIYVYISRRTDPFDDSGPGIPADEWLRYVDAEADFRIPTGEETELMGGHARIWSGHKIQIAFDWSEGQVEVKNPDAPTISRMKQAATKLSATVFSETGELYGQSGEHAGFLPGFP